MTRRVRLGAKELAKIGKRSPVVKVANTQSIVSAANRRPIEALSKR
jgi:hypothetical protein